MEKQKDNRFYVYVYLDPRKSGIYEYGDIKFEYEPYYVGKGTNYRMYVLLRWAKGLKKVNDGNMHKYYLTKSILGEGIEPKILKIQNNISSADACQLEINTIKIIGRKDLNSGPLTNLTDGGEGTFNLSTISREKISKFAKSRIGDFAGEKNPMFGIHRYGKNSPHYGKKHSNETKKKMSISATGRKFSEETKRKMSARHRTEKELKHLSEITTGIKNPNSNLYMINNKVTNEIYAIELVKNLMAFCKLHNLKPYKVHKNLKLMETYEYKNWVFKKIKKNRLYNNF